MFNHDEHNGHNEMQMLDCPESLIARVLDCAFEVHKELGPGLLESVYEQALALELSLQGIALSVKLRFRSSINSRISVLGFVRISLLASACYWS